MVACFDGDAGVIDKQSIQPATHPGGDRFYARFVISDLANHSNFGFHEFTFHHAGLNLRKFLGGFGHDQFAWSGVVAAVLHWD